MQYQVVKGRSVNTPGHAGVRGFRLIGPGETLPSCFGPGDVEFLLAAGAIVAVEAPPEPEAGLPGRVGRWRHDPAALAGRTPEQLRAMILDADPSVDVDDLSEASMVQLLTSEFEPSVAPRASASSDRHRPADQALREARRRAAG